MSNDRAYKCFGIAVAVLVALSFVGYIFLSMYSAATVLIKIEDPTESDLTIKVTGQQWSWFYEYEEIDVKFRSTLLGQDARMNNIGSEELVVRDDDSVSEVDNMLVVPTGRKVRLLVTSNDVIHSWWVPAFGTKKDAIPGYVNEVWLIVEPGKEAIYHGGCTELCGAGHAFMPVVVNAVSGSEFDAWVAAGGHRDMPLPQSK